MSTDAPTVSRAARFQLLEMSGIEQKRMRRASDEDFAGYSPARGELGAKLARAVASLSAPSPIDAESKLSDEWLVTDATALREKVSALLYELGLSKSRARAAREVAAAAPVGLRTRQLVAASIFALLMTAAAVVTSAYLMTISLDAAGVRSWAVDVAGTESGKALSVGVARIVALGFALVVYGGLAGLVLVTAGALGRPVKALYVIGVDIGFALTFACLRGALSDEVGLGFLGWAGVEFVLSLAHGLSMLGIGGWLERQHKLRLERVVKQAAAVAAEQDLLERTAELEEVRDERDRLVNEVADREESPLRKDEFCDLAELSDREAATHASILVCRKYSTGATEALDAVIDGHLNHIAATLIGDGSTTHTKE